MLAVDNNLKFDIGDFITKKMMLLNMISKDL